MSDEVVPSGPDESSLGQSDLDRWFERACEFETMAAAFKSDRDAWKARAEQFESQLRAVQQCGCHECTLARAEKLKKVLDRYGRHDDYCPHSPMRSCTCGFDEALATSKAKEAK